MKVRYLREGYFKNPEQARAAREKAAQQSNVEKLVDVTSKVMVKPIKDYLTAKFNIWGKNKLRLWGKCDKLVDYFNVLPDVFSNHFLLTSTNNESNHAICYWSLADEEVVVSNVDLEHNKIHLTVIISEPIKDMSQGSRSSGYYAEREVGDNEVLFFYLDNFYDEFYKIRKASWSPQTNHIHTHMISLAKDDRYEETKTLPKPMMDFISNAEYEISVIWKLKNDILITGITTSEDIKHFEGNEMIWFSSEISKNWTPADLFNDVHYGDDNTFAGLTRQVIGEIYPVVTNVVRTILGKFKKNIPVKKNISWEELRERCNKQQSGLLCRFSSYDELVHNIRRLFKHYNITVAGDSHIWYRTGNFEKNYMIL